MRHAEKSKERTMAGSVNKVILVGNLGAEPEVRLTLKSVPQARPGTAWGDA